MPRTKPASSPRADALRALAAFLAPGHAPTRRRVELALSAPDAYKLEFAEELEDRNAEDDPVDPWLALVTALTADELGLVRSIDWKSPAEDIAGSLGAAVEAIGTLRKDKRRYDRAALFAFYDEDAHLATKTIDFIALCGCAVSAYGLAVVELDLGSDSYELTVIPWADVAAAKALAKRAGGKLIHHGPKLPLAAPLPKPPPKATGPAKIDRRRLGSSVRDRGFEQTPGVLRYVGTRTRETVLVDCRVWPPKQHVVSAGVVTPVFDHAGDARIVYAIDHALDEDEEFEPRPTGTLRVERGKRTEEFLQRSPDHFDVEFAAWIGKLAVLVPTEPTIRGRTVRRPLVWNGKTLAPAKGLADARAKKGTSSDPWPSFVRAGHARTGSGVDVLIWEGRGYTARGEAFVETWRLVPDLQAGETIIGVPAPGDGFFYLHRPTGRNAPHGSLRHAVAKRCVERARIRYMISGPVRGTPDGRVVIGLNRQGTPKDPCLVVFHPETNELTYVPPQVLAVRKDDQLAAYGATAPSKGPAFLWALDDEELRRVPWSAILALPREPALPFARR